MPSQQTLTVAGVVLGCGLLLLLTNAVFMSPSPPVAPRVVKRREIGPEARFIVIGDFGSGTVEGTHAQDSVAGALSAAARRLQPHFIVTTGDVLYPSGLTSASDPVVKNRFESVYSDPALRIPWHITLGNHDCRGSVSAMMEYAKLSPLWEMPSRYYVKEFTLAGSDIVRIIYLDTCLLVCGTMNNFRCEEQMRPNLSEEAKIRHYRWLERELAVPATWKIVVGHFGIFSMMGNGPTPELVHELLPLLHKHGVQVYFNGHDHSLQHLIPSNVVQRGLNFIVSGGGGYELHPELKAEASAEYNTMATSLFTASTFGFVTARLTSAELHLDFVSAEGAVIYQTTIAARKSS